MANPEKAILYAKWISGKQAKEECYQVQHNPTELSLDKGVQLAEINIPGLDAPLQQFVRGQAEKLSLELFFDTTEHGMGVSAKSVTEKTDQVYRLAKIESDSHAPPIVIFCWNQNFPGDSLTVGNQSQGGPNTNQFRNTFTGLVESIKQKFTLFSPEGVPLRATVNVVLREYRTLEEQLNQLNRNSPDRTHTHVLKRNETLSLIAGNIYGRPDEWRYIANENELEDPRRITSGLFLTIPAIR